MHDFCLLWNIAERYILFASRRQLSLAIKASYADKVKKRFLPGHFDVTVVCRRRRHTCAFLELN